MSIGDSRAKKIKIFIIEGVFFMVLFSKYFFQARAKILNDYGHIWTHLQASTMILKKIYSLGFLCF